MSSSVINVDPPQACLYVKPFACFRCNVLVALHYLLFFILAIELLSNCVVQYLLYRLNLVDRTRGLHQSIRNSVSPRNVSCRFLCNYCLLLCICEG